MKCVDKNEDCFGELQPYVVEQGVFYRCLHHTIEDIKTMSKWGEYNPVIIKEENISEEEVSYFIHQMNEKELNSTLLK